MKIVQNLKFGNRPNDMFKNNFNQSKTQANLRELWIVMKKQGNFKSYVDYDDYLARRNQPKILKNKQEEQENLRTLEINETIRVREAMGKPTENPALAKLKVDAKAFDDEQGIIGNVRIEDIPF